MIYLESMWLVLALEPCNNLTHTPLSPGQSHLIFGTGSTSCVIMSQLSKHCCINVLYKPLENLDAIALWVE
jgi:hypothetical protein